MNEDITKETPRDITVKEHLKNLRDKAHETQRKNGHYKKMQEALRLKRMKK